uniref:RAS and EF-hand domain containing n=1 Tax=Salarias fasciatus TaxID=181472 RepID=A0A672IX00_SALFA
KDDCEEQRRLSALFHAYDVDNSGRIEKNEFSIICQELNVSSLEAERIFNRLDVDKDGTVTLEEFISGFRSQCEEEKDGSAENEYYSNEKGYSKMKEDIICRLGEQAKYIPRNEQASTLYQNISLTEPRLIPQFEKVILNFTKEIKQQNSEMENLALAIKRAQDQASMQLSEMEEEMDQRIHAAERKTREQEKRRTEAALSELRRHYETEVCELQCKIQKMQMIEEKYKTITVKDESPALKKKINELTLENQRLKQEVLRSQTKVACLQSEMDTLKTELTDQSINSERSVVWNQHSCKSGSSDPSNADNYLFSILLRFGPRTEEFPVYARRPSCDTLALAMCDPGLKRRGSSECEEDSLPEIYVDSGLSTLRGSHGGFDSDHDVKGQEEQDDTEGEEAEEETKEEEKVRHVASLIHENVRLRLQNDKDREDLGYMTSEKAYRIVLAGDAAVGKSSFLLRLCKNEFTMNSNTTLGVDFHMKTLVVDGEPVLLQLWDTAGQERFRSIAKSYFRRADGVLLLYDVTCERSFLNVREWVDMIEDVSHEDVPIMLVGNKCDLRQEAANCVPTSYGEKLAMTYNTLFCETSAKDGSNILEAVLHLARQVTKQTTFEEKRLYQSLTSLSAPRKKPNFSCCT